MRLSTKLSLVAAALLTLSACNKEAAEPAAPKLDTDAAKQSYALGVSAGKYIKNAVEENKKLGDRVRHSADPARRARCNSR